MKRFIQIFTLAILLALSVSPPVEAQVAPVNVTTYDQELFNWSGTFDTLVNGDTIKHTWRYYTNFPNQINWLIINDEISGTATNTVKLQESPITDPGTATADIDWYTVATYTLTTDSTILINRDMTYGRRSRLVGTSTGTGRHFLRAAFTLKRQETSY